MDAAHPQPADLRDGPAARRPLQGVAVDRLPLHRPARRGGGPHRGAGAPPLPQDAPAGRRAPLRREGALRGGGPRHPGRVHVAVEPLPQLHRRDVRRHRRRRPAGRAVAPLPGRPPLAVVPVARPGGRSPGSRTGGRSGRTTTTPPPGGSSATSRTCCWSTTTTSRPTWRTRCAASPPTSGSTSPRRLVAGAGGGGRLRRDEVRRRPPARPDGQVRRRPELVPLSGNQRPLAGRDVPGRPRPLRRGGRQLDPALRAWLEGGRSGQSGDVDSGNRVGQ